MHIASWKENQQLAATVVAVEATVFYPLGLSLSLILYQAIYGWILDSKGFPESIRTPKTEYERRSYDCPKLEG